MSYLKPGTPCVIVGGCPKNIGLMVRILAHLGPCPPHADVYKIKTVTGDSFPQVCDSEGNLISGSSNECFTDRHKLRPLVVVFSREYVWDRDGNLIDKRYIDRYKPHSLVGPKDESEIRETGVEDVRNRKRELTDCPS